MKVLFMGSPGISLPFLNFIYNKNCDIMVFTQKDKVRGRGKKPEPTAVSKRAEELGLPVHKTSIKSKESFDIIKRFCPDIFFVVAYGQILPPEILMLPKLYPLNVHFSLLPEYRGATPVNTALLDGKKTTGTTIMIMDKGMDTGDILLYEKCSIEPQDNASSLFEKLIKLSLSLLDENWTEILTGKIEAKAQTGTPCYTKLIKKEDIKINFNNNSEAVHNKIRAFNFEPGTKTIFRKKTLFIQSSENLSGISGEAGRILSVNKKFFTVGCLQGALKIITVKPEGKKSMSAESFINGYKPVTGEILG